MIHLESYQTHALTWRARPCDAVPHGAFLGQAIGMLGRGTKKANPLTDPVGQGVVGNPCRAVRGTATLCGTRQRHATIQTLPTLRHA